MRSKSLGKKANIDQPQSGARQKRYSIFRYYNHDGYLIHPIVIGTEAWFKNVVERALNDESYGWFYKPSVEELAMLAKAWRDRRSLRRRISELLKEKGKIK